MPSDVGELSGPIVATPAGFVRWDRQTRFSTDGVTWSASPLPNPDGFVNVAFAVDGGIIAVGNTFEGVPEVHLLDETGGSPELLDVPGLPTIGQVGSAQPWAPGSAAAFDAGGQGFSILSVEEGGYRLSARPAAGVFELIDVATGEVLIYELADPFDPDAESSFDFGVDGVTVTDPETGAVLVTISQERLDEAEATYFESSGNGQGEQALWVLATADGERFVLDERIGNASNTGNIGVTTNDDRVLVATGDGWASFELP